MVQLLEAANFIRVQRDAVLNVIDLIGMFLAEQGFFQIVFKNFINCKFKLEKILEFGLSEARSSQISQF